MMSPLARDLALALLTSAQARGSVLNKTKLLKLMYLADIEHFRTHRKTLTGFEWIFFLYGPWAAEYDTLVAELEQRDLIEIESWESGGLSGDRLKAKEDRDLGTVLESTNEYFRVKNQVDTWSDRSLSDLLDYVYFDTDPMRDAVSLQPLDFEKVSPDAPTLYRRSKSGASDAAVRNLRRRFTEIRERNEQARQAAISSFVPPTYDEAYQEALAQLSNESEL
jgi:hypothetical protein